MKSKMLATVIPQDCKSSGAQFLQEINAQSRKWLKAKLGSSQQIYRQDRVVNYEKGVIRLALTK